MSNQGHYAEYKGKRKERLVGQEKLWEAQKTWPGNEARRISDPECLCLYQTIQIHRVRRYVECGSANGWSCAWAVQAMLDSGVKKPEAHTWDIEDRTKGWADWEEWITFYHEAFDPNVATRLEGLSSLRTAYFIDGDHSRAAAKTDWKAVQSLTQPEDVVIFHDAQDYAWINRLVFAAINQDEWRGGIVTTPRGMGVIWKVTPKTATPLKIQTIVEPTNVRTNS